MRQVIIGGQTIYVPDDASDEEIEAIVGEFQSTPDDPNKNDLGGILAGLGSRGPAYAAGAPVDLVNNLPGIASGVGLGGLFAPEGMPQQFSDDPVMGSQWLLDRFEDVGIPARTEAESGFGRIVSRGAEELGAALTGMGVGSAMRGAGAVGRLGQALTEAPITQGVASGAAGASSGAMGEMTDSPTAQLAAALMGGGSVAAALPAARRLLGTTADQMTGLFSGSGRQRLADLAVQDMMSAPQDYAGTAALRTQEIVPGSRPMAADVTDDVGLATATRVNAQRPPMNAMFEQRLAERDEARRRLLEAIGVSDRTPEDIGSTIRGEYNVGRSAMRDARQQAYGAVGEAQIPIEDLTTSVDQIMQKYYGPGAGAPPTELRGLIDDLNAGAADVIPGASLAGRTLPYDFLQRLRSRAGVAAEQASRGNQPDSRAAAAAGEIRRLIDNSFASAADSEGRIRGGMTADQVAQFEGANRMRAQEGRLYQQGPVGQLGVTTATGPRVPDEAIPARMTRSYESGRQFGEVFEGSPQAQQALRDYLMSEMTFTRNSAGRIGEPDMRRFRASFANALRGLQETGTITPEHATNIQAVMDDIGRQATTEARGFPRGSPTYQNAQVGQALERSTGGAVPAGLVENGGLVSRVLMTAFRGQREKVDQLIGQILMDPALAAAAAQRATPETWGQFARLLQDKLGVTAGLSGLTELQDQR